MEISQNTGRPLRLASLKEVPSISGYESFTEPSLRHLVFNSEDRIASNGDVIKGNGLASAVIRIGRRVLLDLDEFDRWIGSHRQQHLTEVHLTPDKLITPDNPACASDAQASRSINVEDLAPPDWDGKMIANSCDRNQTRGGGIKKISKGKSNA
tara:strand:- start:148 stop:609 length:462 start_codon:yes stop_codon:yes gene_type:complete